MTHILSFLDAASLVNSELVSRQWCRCASDSLVWKSVVLNDFRLQVSNLLDAGEVLHQSGAGFGKTGPGQDWKKMWKARKSLDQRWSEGYAAAIYLEGHSDSVYCVQFDEYDRSIQIRSSFC